MPTTSNRRITTVVAAGALSLGLGAALVPAAASAAPATAAPAVTAPGRLRDLDVLRARCTEAIHVRLTALERATGALAAARHVTDDHETAQSASLTAAATGLSELEDVIAAETDAATLAAHCHSIVSDFRVFALRVPQTHLVIAGDGASHAVSTLLGLVPRLTEAVGRAEAAGTDVTAAKAALDDLGTTLAHAAGLVDGLADGVIGLTPADYNADHGVLDEARAAVRGAAADLRTARTNVKAIVAILQGAR
ncbi:MAG: hypothetical protein AB7H43_03390 [Acidimicrobiia bacterium]